MPKPIHMGEVKDYAVLLWAASIVTIYIWSDYPLLAALIFVAGVSGAIYLAARERKAYRMSAKQREKGG